jgi:protein-S-isoprenylcysteine O-methyltransferase Ste14
MSLVPAFDIGLWNAWILILLFFLSTIIPNTFLSEEGKKRNSMMGRFTTSNRTEKVLAWSTHLVIFPIVILYSIFLPLKLGAAWLYVGLLIFVIGLAMWVMTTLSVAKTPLDKTATQGPYRVSRHPMYFSGFLILVGIGIACASWVVILCAILWIVFFQIVVPSEERFLLEKSGDSYREYINRTPRWIGLPKSGAK